MNALFRHVMLERLQPFFDGRRGRVVSSVVPAVAWIVLFAETVSIRHYAALASAALWGFLLLWSYVAWGSVLLRAVAPRVRAGWGLEGTLGVAVSLFVGGLLACVRLVSVNAIVIWSLLGVLALAYTRARSQLARPDAAPRMHAHRTSSPLVWSVAVFGLGLMMLLTYLGSVANADFNAWDDNMAYRSFARQFLDAGTLYEPFSYRRIGAYGGQSYLHAMVLAMTDRDRLHIVDNGIAPVLLFGMIAGYRHARWASRFAALAGLVLLVTLPYGPHNLGSALTGVLFFFGLFRVLDDARFEHVNPRARALCVGLLAAAVCTLRQNYMSASGAFVVAAYAAAYFFGSDRARWKREGLYAVGAMILSLAPWMLLCQIMVHTALYPILRGNMRPDFGIQGSVTLAEELRWTWANIFTLKQPIQTLPLLFLAAFAIPTSRRSRALHALLLASMSAYVLMMHFFRTFHDADSIARYYLAFTVAFGLASTIKVLDLANARRGASLFAGALVATALGLQFWNGREALNALVVKNITAAEVVLTQRGDAQAYVALDDLYRRIQDSTAPGAGLLVMLDHTYLLSGKRNPVFHFDHPGVMGPDGIPTFDGPEAWAAYMLAHRVRYVAYQLGNSSVEYKRSMWDQRAASIVPPTGRGGFYKLQATFELASFNTLEELAKTRVNVFNEGEIHVLDLSARK